MHSAGTATSGNLLAAPSLARIIRSSLPKDASPQIKNAYDAVALVSHAALLAVGFRLIGLGEDHKIDAQSDNTSVQTLPPEWNAHAGSYAFRYAHSQSSMEYLLKVNRMGNKAVVMGMGMGDDKTCSFDVKVQDFISDGNLPASPTANAASEQDAEESITNIFISLGRLSDLGSMFRISIIQKLIPSLRKEGYEEQTVSQDQADSSAADQQQPRRPPPADRDPLRDDRFPQPNQPFPLADPLAQPRRPMPEPMPGFDDELETQRPLRGGVPGAGGYPRIGDRDLYPAGLGPNDPLRGGGGGPGFGGMGGGGMHPTFDDPLFAGQGGRGGGFNPQAPPGARFEDPFGQGGARGGHPRGAGMGGRPPNPFGGFGDGDFI